jgi:hypothetical protein
MTEVRLTRRGRRALKAKLRGVSASPGARLVLEVMGRIEHATLENATELVEQLLDRYGSPEAAIVALESGFVGFELDDQAEGKSP